MYIVYRTILFIVYTTKKKKKTICGLSCKRHWIIKSHHRIHCGDRTRHYGKECCWIAAYRETGSVRDSIFVLTVFDRRRHDYYIQV